MSETFNENLVDEVRINIETEFAQFLKNSERLTNKAGSRRARKNSIELSNLLKEYRKLSIK